VGRPGFDPGTLGIGPDHASAFVVVPITWSVDAALRPTSTEILSDLIPWLHNWLHRRGSDVYGDVKICASDGREIEVRLKGPHS